jgi:predicted TIM-barrel fold metal-dependent hydrolase
LDATAPPDSLAGYTIVDAHVHAFPPRVFAAIWRWFDAHAWPVRRRLQARETVTHLLARGVSRVVLLHYPHVPGMAASLNAFGAELAREEPRAIACASVLPGEPGARAILDEALGPLGCRGVKIHCHVQCLAPDDARLDDVYDAAAAHGVPVVIHAGDAPAFRSASGEGCDVHALCTPEALGRALARHPRATVIVPHLGAARMEEVAALLAEHERLYLDTTMAIAGFLPFGPDRRTDDALAPAFQERALALVRLHADRILYGSDFPNLPFAWDRELGVLAEAGLEPAALGAILGGTAARLFDLSR